MAVIGLDIGGTNVRAGLFPERGRLAATAQVSRRQFGESLPIAALGDFGAQCLAAWELQYGTVKAVGLGVAAVVDAATGYVHVGENLGWRDQPLGALLRERWQRPVAVDVDAFCGALGEARYGSGREYDSFLYVVIGTGIGHGLVLDGRVRHGAHAAANVFGHLKVVPGGAPCYCGGCGCLCQYASGSGLARVGAELAGREGVTGAEVVAASGGGEAWAQRAIDQWLDYVALALSSVYNLLDIETTVLGGGVVSETFPDLDQLHRRLLPLVYPQVRPLLLRRAALGEHSVLMGAAALAFDLQKRGES